MYIVIPLLEREVLVEDCMQEIMSQMRVTLYSLYVSDT